jgi:hypothetical protein
MEQGHTHKKKCIALSGKNRIFVLRLLSVLRRRHLWKKNVNTPTTHAT